MKKIIAITFSIITAISCCLSVFGSSSDQIASGGNSSPNSGYITDVWGNLRFDLTPYVGGDYHDLLAATSMVRVLQESPDEVKIGNDHVSITATAGGIITRVRLDGEDTDFSVCGTYAGHGTSDLHYEIWNAGYEEKGESADGQWRIFENETAARFLAYKAQYANADQIYFGIIGYMPFS